MPVQKPFVVNMTNEQKRQTCNDAWAPVAKQLRRLGFDDHEIGQFRVESHRLAMRPVLPFKAWRQHRAERRLWDISTPEEIQRVVEMWQALKDLVDSKTITNKSCIDIFMEEVKADAFELEGLPPWTPLVHENPKFSKLPVQLGITIPFDVARQCGLSGVPTKSKHRSIILVLTGGNARGAYSVTPTPVSDAIHKAFGIINGYSKTGHRFWYTCNALHRSATSNMQQVVREILESREVYSFTLKVKVGSKYEENMPRSFLRSVFDKHESTLARALQVTMATLKQHKKMSMHDYRAARQPALQPVAKASPTAPITGVVQPVPVAATKPSIPITSDPAYISFALDCGMLDLTPEESAIAARFFVQHAKRPTDELLLWVKTAKDGNCMDRLLKAAQMLQDS